MSSGIFKDRRGRVWEWFFDYTYYGMVCIRLKGDVVVNSKTNFHFESKEIADTFIEVLKLSR